MSETNDRKQGKQAKGAPEESSAARSKALRLKTRPQRGGCPLRPSGRMELGRTVDAGSIRQSFSRGRSKVVQVEVRKSAQVRLKGVRWGAARGGRGVGAGGRALTASELATRQRVRKSSALRQHVRKKRKSAFFPQLRKRAARPRLPPRRKCVIQKRRRPARRKSFNRPAG